MTNLTQLAGSWIEDPFVPGQIFAGESFITTESRTLLSGQNIVALAPLGRVTATGKLKLWAPGASDGTEKLMGFACFDVNASGGDKAIDVYEGGVFNVDAIQWPGGTTNLQKLTSCDNSRPLGVRALAGSTTVLP